MEVRTPIDPLLEALVDGLAAQGQICIVGKHELRVVNLAMRDRLLFSARTTIRTSAPIAVYRTTDDKDTIYYSPNDEEWLQLVNENAARKAEFCGLTCDSTIQKIPLESVVTSYV